MLDSNNIAGIARQDATRARPRRSAHKETLTKGMVVRLERIVGVTARGILAQPFTFQAPPINTLPINRSYPQTHWDTIAGQQMSRPGIVQLKTISFDSVFCDDPWSWTLLHGDGYQPNPLTMIKRLEEVAEAQQPFWLTIRNPAYRDGYDVNMAATLVNFNTETRDGEPDARYVTVGFEEFLDPSLKTRALPGTARNSSLPVTLRADQLPNDRGTLHLLAIYYYGSASEWRRVAKANRLTRSPSYDLRQLGNRKITVPRKP